jgi:hypothetical protein
MRTPKRALWCVVVASTFLVHVQAHAAAPDSPVRVLARPWLAHELVRSGLADAEARRIESAARARLSALGARMISGPEIGVITVAPGRDDSVIAELEATGDFRCVARDTLLRLVSVEPNDPLFGSQWHLPAIRAPEAWDAWTGDPSGVVAVVDTGVDSSHPDLGPALLPGYNAVTRLAQADGGLVDDVHWHGTSVAGAAAARGNDAYGTTGVGWNLAILPVRASNVSSGAAFLTDVVDGVTWSVQNGASVVNVSYEGVWEPIVQILGEWSMGLDVPLVWAAGNAAINLNWFDHPDVVVVSGTTESSVRWNSSAFGPAIDIAAPARYIYGPKKGGGWSSRSGTSFSTALVSGTIALGRSARPDLSAAQIVDAILASASDLGEPGEDDEFGHGLVDTKAFLDAIDVLPPGDDDPDTGGVAPPNTESTVILAPAANPERLAPGLRTSYYYVADLGAATIMPIFGGIEPFLQEVLPTFNLLTSASGFGSSGLLDDVGVVVDGWIQIPEAGRYRFMLSSVDGSRLWIGGICVIDLDGVHPLAEKCVNAQLQAGHYPIRVEYFAVSGTPTVRLDVSRKGVGGTLDPTWCTFEPALADYNVDGSVDIVDLLDFIGDLSDLNPRADVNGDTAVDVLDFLDFLDWFGM